jgi:hypothetical protein
MTEAQIKGQIAEKEADNQKILREHEADRQKFEAAQKAFMERANERQARVIGNEAVIKHLSDQLKGKK